MSATKHVYEAINVVSAQMAKEGISKDRTSAAGGGASFRFRGVDDVLNALAPKLAAAKLCILPRVLERQITERTSKSGSVMSYVVLTVEFDLVSSVDSSMHTVRTMGEAMDSGDKATNKAMSAAYKYACFQTFTIPTEGDHDTENHAHELAPAPKAAAPSPAKRAESDEAEAGLTRLLQEAVDVDQLTRATIAVEKERKASRISQAGVGRLRNIYAAKINELKAAS